MRPANRRSPPRRWWWPLAFFQLYLSFSVWLFFFGPWPWDVDDPLELFSYLAAAQVAIAAGYALSRRRVASISIEPRQRELEILSGIRFLKASMLVTALLAVPSSLSRTGAALPDILGGLGGAGLAYNENFERLESGNAFVVVEYLRMLVSPWLTALFPLTVLYWGRLAWRWRVAALALIAFNLGIFLATGTNKGIADTVVTLPWLVALAVWCGTLRVRRVGLKLALGSLVLGVGFLAFFSAGQQQREGSGVEYGTFFTGASVLQADTSNFVSALLPEEFRVVFEALSRYLVHGYYALSMALHTHTPSTMGFGNSMFLARNADEILGTNFFVSQSIPGVLENEQGWGRLLLWHSIYPWLASDVGFGGALVVMAGFGYLLGLSWGKALATTSARWTVLLYLLLIVFFYTPANNQVFQSGETCFAFFILLFMVSSRHPGSAVAVRRVIAKSVAP